MKILVVEDDPLIRRSLRELVEAWGYACDDAGDGLVALDLLQACPYDLVLLDLNLPKRDGLARQSGRDLSRGWPARVRSAPCRRVEAWQDVDKAMSPSIVRSRFAGCRPACRRESRRATGADRGGRSVGAVLRL